jgi:hypothetical protein
LRNQFLRQLKVKIRKKHSCKCRLKVAPHSRNRVLV